jgi:hypothetical protein
MADAPISYTKWLSLLMTAGMTLFETRILLVAFVF